MKFNVREVHTPEDVDLDRVRYGFEFKCDGESQFDIAFAAVVAAHGEKTQALVSKQTKENIHACFDESDVFEQVSAQDDFLEEGFSSIYDLPSLDFHFLANNGKWNYSITRSVGP